MPKQLLSDWPRIQAERTVVNAETGCIEWTGFCTEKGYGRCRIDGKWTSTHRTAFSWFNGGIPDGLHVLHRCDNPKCCNPEHLYAGTNDENMADKARNGRSGKELNKQKALEVIDMLAEGYKQAEIAEIMGVNPSNISRIHTGHRWAHVQSVSV